MNAPLPDPMSAIKPPPYSLEAEYSVLGGLLIDNSAWDRIADVVDERDFYTLDHRKIFRAISRLLEDNKAADVVTVAEFLQRHGELESIGSSKKGLAYLVDIQSNTPSSANIRRYGEIVRERALLRRLIGALRESEDKAYSPGGMATREVVDFVQSKVNSVTESASKGQGGPQHVGPVMDDVLRHIDELSSRAHQTDVTGLPTGFTELDKMTTGFQPGELIILAARPSMGKTALALNIAEYVALHQKKNVAFFSLEMANNQLGTRLVSSVSRLNQQRVKVGRLNQDEFKKLFDAASKLRDSQIYLDEEGELSATEIRARCRRLHRECGGLHLVIIDYLQLMQTSGRSDNRAYELAEVSRALKNLSKELHLPVIALSQLNRGLEQRPNKRPIMSDLRDSGGIEQDADLILFVYRDEVYRDDSPDKGIAELIIGKQRNGPTGTVYVNFRGELIRFDDRDRHEIVPSRQEKQERQSRRQPAAPRANFRDVQEAGYVDM